VSWAEKSRVLRKEYPLTILCSIALITVITVLFATLWPFNFSPRNNLNWLPEGKGIVLIGHGVAVSETAFKLGIGARQSLSLELLLRPAGVQSAGTILCFYNPDEPTQFLLRQSANYLVVSHDVVDTKERNGIAKLAIDKAFEPGKLVLITITSGPNGTFIYTNGRQVKFSSQLRISPSDLSGQIILGTSSVEYKPWEGEIHGLAIYPQELTPSEVLQHFSEWVQRPEVQPSDLDGAIVRYAFSEGAGRKIHSAVATGPDLRIPKGFSVPHKPLLESPLKEFAATRTYLRDLVLNVAMFVPVGSIFYACWALTRGSRHSIFYAICCGGLLSLVIELLQAWIPVRFSGTTDVITNTAGAALGAILIGPQVLRTVLGRGTDTTT
jgi:hypothetical protein